MGKPDFVDVDSMLSAKMGRKPSRILVAILKRLIHQDWMNSILVRLGHLKDVVFMKAIVDDMKIVTEVVGKENLPKSGTRNMFVCNHPLGGVDVISVVSVVGPNYPEGLMIPANDMLLHMTQIKDMLIPINRVGAVQDRHLAETLNAAYASDVQMMFFPAGMVSRKRKGVIKDEPWKKNFVIKSVESKRNIVPIRVEAENSRFFYFLANFRKRLGIKVNLEMMLLANELYMKRGERIKITIGKPIEWQHFNASKSPRTWAQEVKEQVYTL